ncbi:hypothetical protein F4859DRAFT_518017 [Xylaria cf. heliscus]|nr:hypothetical protein F4859DRAFT_518017 [Xylaria cf. heliscus]
MTGKHQGVIDQVFMCMYQDYDYIKEHLPLGPNMRLDVSLSCGDRVWLLRSHKLRRSPWFERALEGDFENPSDKTIKIEEFEPDSVDWVVKHLITNKYNWEKLQGDQTFTQLCLHVFDLGEFFLLPYLSSSAEAGFRRMLFTLVPDFQTNDPHHHDRTPELLDIIREVYANENPRARKIFGSTIAMILDSIRYGIKGKWLIELIDEIPAVAVDMVKFTATHHSVPCRYPDACDECNAPRAMNLGFSRVSQPSIPRCLCWHCDGQTEAMAHVGIEMKKGDL